MEIASYQGDRLSRAQFRRHIDGATALVLVAGDADHLLGNVVVFFRRNASVARLYSLTVAATARGHGIGRRLLDAAEQAARKRHCTTMTLEVRTENTTAMALYEERGYQRHGCRTGYYEDGAGAWLYRKPLMP